jgi:hypothetical protein
MRDHFNEGTLTMELLKIEINTVDPFQVTIKYSECIDSFFLKRKTTFSSILQSDDFQKELCTGT